MRLTACSTNVFSEMNTLQSIPTSSALDLVDNPLFQEREFMIPVRDNDVPPGQVTFSWRPMNSRSAQANRLQQRDSPTTSSSFNYRKLMRPKKQQEEKFEAVQTAIKEDEIEFEGRVLEGVFFPGTRSQSDADFGFVDGYDELAFDSSDAFLLDGHEVSCAAQSSHSSTEKLCATHPMPDTSMSLAEGSNIMVGAPGRALHKKRAAARLV